MYSRELFEYLANIQQLLGVEGDLTPTNLRQQLIEIVTKSKYLDKTTADQFIASEKKDKSGYDILPGDNELIRNIKAVINLLGSVDNINKSIIQPIMQRDAPTSITGVMGAAKDAIVNREQLKKLGDDVKALTFYIGLLGNLLPKLSDNVKSPYEEMSNLSDSVTVNQAKDIILRELKDIQRVKLARPVPVINMNVILNAIDGFGLKTNINALVEMTGCLVVKDRKVYDEMSDRFIVSSDDPRVNSYNLSRDLKFYIDEAKALIEIIMADPNYSISNILWAELNSDIRAKYVMLNENLKMIASQLDMLNNLCNKDSQLKEIATRNKAQVTQQKAFLQRWINSTESQNIDKLQIEMGQIVGVADVLVEKGITPAVRNKYLQYENNVYDIPAEDKELETTQKNLMVIHNVCTRSQSILSELQTAKQKPFPTIIASMMGVLKEVGMIVADVEKLDRQQIAKDAKVIIQDNLKNVFLHAIGFFEKAVVIAQEIELRLGLQSGTLLGRLDIISSEMQKLITRVDLKLTVPSQPYMVENKIAVRNIKNETEQLLKLLRTARESITLGTNNLVNIIQLKHKLSQLPLRSAYDYANYLQTIINEETGINALDREIKALEFKVLTAVSNQEFLEKHALMATSADSIRSMVLPKEAVDSIKSLRKLYSMRDQLEQSINIGLSPLYYSEKQHILVKNEKEIKAPNKNELDRLQDLAAKEINAHIQEKENAVKNMQQILGEKDKEVKIDTNIMQALMEVNLMAAPQTLTLTQPQLKTNQQLTSRFSSEQFFSVSYDSKMVTASSSSLQSMRQSTKFVTERSKRAMEPVIADSVLQLDDHDMVRYLIERNKSPVVLQSEAARKRLIEIATQLMSAGQSAGMDAILLRADRQYTIDSDDLPFAKIIKTIYNTMVAFENVMLLVNQFQMTLSSSYLDYKEIPELILKIKKAVEVLKKDVEGSSGKLNLLREYMANTPLYTSMIAPLTMVGTMTQQLLTQVGMEGDKQVELIEAAKDLSIVKVDTIKPVFSLQRATSMAVSAIKKQQLSAQKVVAGFSEWIDQVKQQLASTEPNTDGTYDLTKFENDSQEKSIAALINAYYKVLAALNSTKDYASGHTVSGFLGLALNIYAAWSFINESNTISQATDAKKMIETKYLELKNLLNDQIKDWLTIFAPYLQNIRIEAALKENELGLKRGILVDQIDQYAGPLTNLCNYYKINADFDFMPLPLPAPKSTSLLSTTISSVTTQFFSIREPVNTELLSALQIPTVKISAEEEQESQAKIRELLAECIDAKHYYAQEIYTLYMKAYPKENLSINLNAPLELSKNVDANTKLALAVDKYNAFYYMQKILESSRQNASIKLAIISPVFEQHKDLISTIRSSNAASHFVRSVGHALGWRGFGEKKAENISSVLSSSSSSSDKPSSTGKPPKQ